MTRSTVPLDAQSVISACMYASVASYVMGQQNTVGNCPSSEQENWLIQTRHGELPVAVRLHC